MNGSIGELTQKMMYKIRTVFGADLIFHHRIHLGLLLSRRFKNIDSLQ